MAIYTVRPRPNGLIMHYAGPNTYHKGDYIFIEADQSQTVAVILSGPIYSLSDINEDSLPVIIRQATEQDMDIIQKNNICAQNAFNFCKYRICARGLEMKLIEVEIFFDRSKYIFYFTAPGRIDFRELVKDLVAEYRSRIELRQIGARHETQLVGALGNCGQVCCCRRHLRKFAPVTIRMAKDQNLFLNPAKISGICGRLLCCLSYEQDIYEQFQKQSPRAGKKYFTDKGVFKVSRVNMFKNHVIVITEENAETEFSLEQWLKLNPYCDGSDTEQVDDAPAWTKITYDSNE